MKKANILIVSIFIVLIAGILVVFAIILGGFGLFEGTSDVTDYSMKRYMAICTTPQTDGWQDAKRGITDAAAKNNAAVEFLEIGFDEARADASCIEMAVDSGVDGIVIYISDEDIDAELAYAAKNSVPVISIINDYENTKLYEIGADTSMLVNEMVEYVNNMEQDSSEIAVISSGQSEGYRTTLFLTEISRPGRAVKRRSFSGQHVFDASETVKELIASNPDIDIICCMDANATLGVAQSIVEMNKVNVIKIVGCGKTDEILNMIQKGIVSATVAVDYEKIGAEAIRQLVGNSSKPAEYGRRVLTDIYVIDEENVRSFIGEKAE